MSFNPKGIDVYKMEKILDAHKRIKSTKPKNKKKTWKENEKQIEKVKEVEGQENEKEIEKVMEVESEKKNKWNLKCWISAKWK